MNNRENAPALPESTVDIIKQTLQLYSVTQRPNQVAEVVVFDSNTQLIGAVDLRDQKQPQSVNRSTTEQMMWPLATIVEASQSMGQEPRFARINYRVGEIIIIPHEKYNISVRIN